MAAEYLGHATWEGEMDDEGHRDYVLRCKISTLPGEGPATVLTCPSPAPQPGQLWLFSGSGFSDTDVWAYRTLKTKVRPHPKYKEGDKGRARTIWYADYHFTTRPRKKCSEERIEDPLLEPQRVSGGSVRKKKHATLDKDGLPIVYSSGEAVTGPAVEFDRSDSKITVRQNVAALEGYLVESMLDTLNDAPLWGYPIGWVKFSSWNWEKNYHGQCSIYYTRTFEFEISPEHDRTVLDESNKCLKGDWDRDPDSATYKRYVLDESVQEDYDFAVDNEMPEVVYEKPSNVVRFKDWFGENSKTLLNGYGKPYRFPEDDEVEPPDPAAEDDLTRGEITIAYYRQANLLLLGIPSII